MVCRGIESIDMVCFQLPCAYPSKVLFDLMFASMAFVLVLVFVSNHRA
jgi:hypothetical protein